MASQSSTQAWWTRDKQASLQNRIRAIQRLNDPTTNADELLRGSKILLFLLLAFTGLLAAFSYYKNFAGSFPIAVAIFMALALTIAIEWGKNYCTTWAIRTPFFKGFGHIIGTPANTFVFIGLVAVALATFAMSVRNSTIGGRQLSVMLNQERNTTPFAADTRGIDSLIANAQANINSAAQTKWKGTTTRESQRAITAQTKALESLNRQRETLIAQQREDWQSQQAIAAENRDYAGSLVLTSGGWVELLQALLILIRVACEKILDSRMSRTPEEEEKGIGFRRGYSAITAEHTTTPPVTEQEHPRRPIGFFRDREPEKPLAKMPEHPTVPITVPDKNAVEQCSTAKTARTAQPEQSAVPTTSASVLADVKDWQKRATQCFHRALNQQREEFRQDNWQRCTCFCVMLQAVGVEVTRDDERMILQFKEPATYRTDETVIAVIKEQKQRLEQITERRRKP